MTDYNPFLKKLGYSADDRVVIFHADDVGMCQATVTAFKQLIEQQVLNSGAAMVPCSWFPSAASYCREFPNTDLGVHMTFTSEWQGYRWRPLSTSDTESGLIDSEGYFFSTTDAVHKNGIAKFIEGEVAAQINLALAAGVDVSHIDMHMGAMLHPNFLPAYLQAGRTHRIPMLAYRMSEEKLQKWNNPQLAAKIKQILAELEDQGFPIIDHFYQTDLSRPETRMDEIDHVLKTLEPGLTHFITHPAHDTPELRAITTDWAGRVADYHALEQDEFLKCLNKYNIQRIGYRELRDVMRSQ